MPKPSLSEEFLAGIHLSGPYKARSQPRIQMFIVSRENLLYGFERASFCGRDRERLGAMGRRSSPLRLVDGVDLAVELTRAGPMAPARAVEGSSPARRRPGSALAAGLGAPRRETLQRGAGGRGRAGGLHVQRLRSSVPEFGLGHAGL